MSWFTGRELIKTIEEKTQSRWRSKTAWASVLSLGLFIAKNYLHYNVGDSDQLVNLVLVTLTALGIFNNPEKADGF